MGNCCSDVSSGAGAIAGVGGSASSAALGATNDAVDYYLKSKGFNGLFSQIEVPSPSSISRLFLRPQNTLYICLLRLNFFGRRVLFDFLLYLRDYVLVLQLSFSASNLRDRDVLSKVSCKF